MIAAGIELAQPNINLPGPGINLPGPPHGGGASLLSAQPAPKLGMFLSVLDGLLDQSEIVPPQGASARLGGMLALNTAGLSEARPGPLNTSASKEKSADRPTASTQLSASAAEGVRAGGHDSGHSVKSPLSASVPPAPASTEIPIDGRSTMNYSPPSAPTPTLLADRTPNLVHGSLQPTQLPGGDPGGSPTSATSNVGNVRVEYGNATSDRFTSASGSLGDLAFALHLNWQPLNSSLARLAGTASPSGHGALTVESIPLSRPNTETLPFDGASDQLQNLGANRSLGSTSSFLYSHSQVSSVNGVLLPEAPDETGRVNGVAGGPQTAQIAQRPVSEGASSDRPQAPIVASTKAFSGADRIQADRLKDDSPVAGPDSGKDDTKGSSPPETVNDESSILRDSGATTAWTVESSSNSGANSGANSRVGSPASTLLRNDIGGAHTIVGKAPNSSAANAVPGPDAPGPGRQTGALGEKSPDMKDTDREDKNSENPDSQSGSHTPAAAGPNLQNHLVSPERGRDHQAPQTSSPAPIQVTAPARNEAAGGTRTHNSAEQSQASGVSLETKQIPMQPLREITFHLSTDASRVDVQLAERAGKIQVAVRTADPDLTNSLQSNLGDLVGRLENQGFKTDSWIPATAQHGAEAGTTTPKEPSGFADSQGRGDQSAGGGQHSQQRSQQESDQRQQGRWKSQFDAVVSPFRLGASGT